MRRTSANPYRKAVPCLRASLARKVVGEKSPLHSLGDSESRTTASGSGEEGQKQWLRVLSSQLSPVRFVEELCEIPPYFACFGNGTAEFLYGSDCVAVHAVRC